MNKVTAAYRAREKARRDLGTALAALAEYDVNSRRRRDALVAKVDHARQVEGRADRDLDLALDQMNLE